MLHKYTHFVSHMGEYVESEINIWCEPFEFRWIRRMNLLNKEETTKTSIYYFHVLNLGAKPKPKNFYWKKDMTSAKHVKECWYQVEWERFTFWSKETVNKWWFKSKNTYIRARTGILFKLFQQSVSIEWIEELSLRMCWEWWWRYQPSIG